MESRWISRLALVVALGAPAVASAGIVNRCPITVIPAVTAVTVCVNGQYIPLPTAIITRGKLSLLLPTVVDLGLGASFSVSAIFNPDPFSSFAFGSVVPNGFGPIAFDVYFTTLVAPGSYTSASSNGTVGVTATGPAGTTGEVSAGTYPFYIEGLGDGGNLGVDTGSGTCTASTPPSPSSNPCVGTVPGASNTFAPISPFTLTAHLSYTHNTLTSGSSAVAWTGSVELLGSTVPEPATLGLVAAGVLMVGGVGLRRKRNG